jgi:hypothetical protein
LSGLVSNNPSGGTVNRTPMSVITGAMTYHGGPVQTAPKIYLRRCKRRGHVLHELHQRYRRQPVAEQPDAIHAIERTSRRQFRRQLRRLVERHDECDSGSEQVQHLSEPHRRRGATRRGPLR